MKKFFALMLALCLALCAVSAFAEGNTNEVKQIKWSDFEEKKPEGAMTVIDEIGMELYIPQELIRRTVSEEAAAKGIKMVLSNKDETAVVNAQISPVTLDAFKAALANSGINGITELEINGLKCINFNVTNNNVLSTSFAFQTKDNNTVVFSFSPANVEPNTGLFRIMAASIQAAE